MTFLEIIFLRFARFVILKAFNLDDKTEIITKTKLNNIDAICYVIKQVNIKQQKNFLR